MARLFSGLEKRDVTVVGQDLWRSHLFSTSTPSGLNITADSAMTVTAYFAAVRFRAFAVASLPKILYQRTSSGKRRASEKSLYRVIHDEPNADMTSFDLWAMLDSHVTTRGNAYAEIVTDRNGEIQALYPLRPDKMEVKRQADGSLIYVYTLPESFGSKKVSLLPEQVLHLRGLTSDGVMGIAQITYMRNALGLAKATETYGSAYFGNGANPGVVLKHPSRIKDGEMVNRLRSQWEEMHSGLDNAHRVAILEEGMSVEKVGLSPEDSQFLQTREFQIYEVSRMTDVPPSMIFELTKANFASLEQMTLDFVVHHFRPTLVAYEQQCNRSLLMRSEKDSGYFVENLLDGLLRGDLLTRYNAYSIGKQNGWLSTNDILRLENRNTIGPKGDVYMAPLNMSVIGEDGLPMPVTEKNPPEPNTPARSMLPLLRDAAERIGKRELNEFTAARQKHKTPEKFTAWADQFYKRDYPAFIKTVVKPLVEADFLGWETCERAIETYCTERGALALSDDLAVFVTDEIVKLFEEVGDGQE
jgi:HK97 family phage portal protein